MKAKIIKKEYYVAKTEDNSEYYVDFQDEKIQEAYKSKKMIEGVITEESIQDVYDDGTYAKSYSVIEKFVPICNCDCKCSKK